MVVNPSPSRSRYARQFRYQNLRISSQRHAGKAVGKCSVSKAIATEEWRWQVITAIPVTLNVSEYDPQCTAEVINAGIQVLNKLAAVLGEFEFYFDHFDWSSDIYKRTGKYIPDGGLESLKAYDAILFGAFGDQGSPFRYK